MSVNDYETDSLEVEKFEKDEALLERMRPVLGNEAIDRFFDATEKMPMALRSLAFVSLNNLANFVQPYVDKTDDDRHDDVVVELPLHEEPDYYESVYEEPTVVDLDAREEHKVIDLPIAEIPEDPVVTEVPSVSEAKESVEAEPLYVESIENKKSLAKLMPKSLRDIFDETLLDNLTADDADAVVATLIELRGPVVVRAKRVDSYARLHAFVSGLSAKQVAELEGSGTDLKSARTWVQLYGKNVRSKESYSLVHASNVLRGKLSEDKQQMIPGVEAAADLAPIEAASNEEVSSPVDLSPEQTEELFDRLMERFSARGCSKQEVQGLKKILNFYDGDYPAFKEVALAGRAVLDGLLSTSARDRQKLIVDEGQGWAKKAHDYLRYLSGNNLNNQELPLRIETIAQKYQKDKEEVRRDSLALINYLLSKENSKDLKVALYKDPENVPETHTPVHRRVATPEVLQPESEPKTFDMFLVAAGEVQVSPTDWNNSIGGTFFDRAKNQGVITATQAVCLLDRINQSVAQANKLTDDDKNAIESLKELWASKSPRLAANRGMREALDMFINRNLTLNEMTELRQDKSPQLQPRSVRRRVERDFYGGLSELLGMNKDL